MKTSVSTSSYQKKHLPVCSVLTSLDKDVLDMKESPPFSQNNVSCCFNNNQLYLSLFSSSYIYIYIYILSFLISINKV